MIKPMLAQIGKKPDLSKKGYFFEPKLDGTRAICTITPRQITFINRRNNNITRRYPEIVNELREVINAERCILDGEIVVYDDKGNPSFNLLQKREQVDKLFEIELRSSEYPATYVVFDILDLNGKSLLSLPLVKRKEILDGVVQNGKHVEKIYSTENGKALWKEVVKRKLEGVMAKPKASLYHAGERPPVWLKIKYLKTLDCVIAGYTHEKRIISSIAVAAYRNGKLHYLGRVGTGFTEEFLKDLHKKLKRVSKPSVVNPPRHPIFWVKPELVCEVEFLELTKRLELRAPSFQRLRYDKPVKECIF
jgi:bifunctional non-homologous end joining protein LigD